MLRKSGSNKSSLDSISLLIERILDKLKPSSINLTVLGSLIGRLGSSRIPTLNSSNFATIRLLKLNLSSSVFCFSFKSRLFSLRSLNKYVCHDGTYDYSYKRTRYWHDIFKRLYSITHVWLNVRLSNLLSIARETAGPPFLFARPERIFPYRECKKRVLLH